MRVTSKGMFINSPRHVRTAAYETVRLLLTADGAAVGLTDIVLAPGIEETYGYDNRTEIAYCLEGSAEITDLATGTRYAIVPGTLWVASPGERFRFRAEQPTRLVCVFLPPLEGGETGFAADMAAPA